MGRRRMLLAPIRSPLLRELVALIDRNPMTQAQITERAGLPQSSISFLATGRRQNPGVLTLERIAAVYGYELILRPRRRRNITESIISIEEVA